MENDDSIHLLALQIYDHAMYQLHRQDAADISESVAYELISLAEWMSMNYNDARLAVSIIIKDYALPFGTTAYLKKHFNLSY